MGLLEVVDFGVLSDLLENLPDLEEVKVQLQREKNSQFVSEVCNQREEGPKINYRLAVQIVHNSAAGMESTDIFKLVSSTQEGKPLARAHRWGGYRH